MLFFIKKH